LTNISNQLIHTFTPPDGGVPLGRSQ